MFTENYKWNYDYVRLALDSGFYFERHKVDDFDKNRICLVDIERVVRERDLGTIEKFIPCVTHFVLDPEQAQILDGTFAKIFRVSQLSIEYLLFCKRYLDQALVRKKDEIAKVSEENQELRLFVEDLKQHVSTLMKEINEKSAAAFRCELCNKIFSSEEFLNSHIKRRHSSNLASEIETEKLNLEIKELKGRLNSAEKMIQKEQAQLQPTRENDNFKDYELKKIDELQQKFEELRIEVQSELKVLQAQNNFQEKYEKLVDKITQNQDLKEAKTEGLNLKMRRESTTQTEIDLELPEKSESPKTESPVDVNYAQQQIIEFGGALETKVTSSLEKIETQMQTFWEKLNQMEIHRTKSCSDDGKENQMPRPIKPKSKYTVTSRENNQNSSSSTSHFENLSPKRAKKQVLEPALTPQKKVQQVISVPALKIDIPVKKISSSEASFSDSETVSQVADVINCPTKPVVSEELFEHFKREVENIVINGRLQDLGVSPEWKGLPLKSFTRALEIVKHQANLMKKTYPDLDLISAEIEREVAKRLENIVTKNKGLKKLMKGKRKKIADIEIKNRKMYETDSESEIKLVSAKPKGNLKEISPSYSAVIEELKTVTTKKVDDSDKSESKDENDKPEDYTKGVLKSNVPSVASITKKKVLFNLENDAELFVTKKDGGSTTSIPSSVLDGTPRKLKEHSKKRYVKEEKDIEDLSDFDFSDM